MSSIYCPKTTNVKWDVVMDVDVDAVFEGKAKLNRDLLAHVCQAQVNSGQPESSDPMHLIHLFRVTQALVETTLYENNRYAQRLHQFEQQVKSLTEESEKLRKENGVLKGEIPGITPMAAPAAVSSKSVDSQMASDECKALQEKVRKMQEQYTAVMKQKTTLADELEKLKLSSTTKPADESTKSEIDTLRQQLAQKQKETEELRQSMDGKLSESAQFRNLRGMLNQKNDLVKELRERLRKYEPDTVPTSDE